MNIVHAHYKNISLVGGYQFWSNPLLSETDSVIPVVLSRPTLVDLIKLAGRFGVPRLSKENNELFISGELSKLTYQRNVRRLHTIEMAAL